MSNLQRAPGGTVLILADDIKVMADILRLGLECFRCRKKKSITPLIEVPYILKSNPHQFLPIS
jgi:hypothetical protein